MKENSNSKNYLLSTNWKIENPDISFEEITKINKEILLDLIPSFLYNIGENLASDNIFNIFKKENLDNYKNWLESLFPSKFNKERHKFFSLNIDYFMFSKESKDNRDDIENVLLNFIFFNYLEEVLSKPDSMYLRYQDEIFYYDLNKNKELIKREKFKQETKYFYRINWNQIKELTLRLDDGNNFLFFYNDIFTHPILLTFSLGEPGSSSWYILQGVNISEFIEQFIYGIYININEGDITGKGEITIGKENIYTLKAEYNLNSFPKNIKEFTTELKNLFIKEDTNIFVNKINQEVKNNPINLSQDLFNSPFKLPKTFNLLLEGKPGVGKTRWVQSFCKEVLEPLNYLFIQTDLVTLTKIKLPKFARKRICFILDDVDNLALDRKIHVNNKETDQILKILDGSSFNNDSYESVVILMTANSTENWDKAALRKGRIHKLYHFETDFGT